MDAGLAGNPVTVRQREMLLPQALLAVTQTDPVTGLPNRTTTELVPCPEVTAAPAGTVHVYEVAPFTALIEYGTADRLHKLFACPVIPPGVVGTERIVVDLLALVPQELLAFTLSVPEVNTAGRVN